MEQHIDISNFKHLTSQQHIRLRLGMYLGSKVESTSIEKFIEGDRIVEKEVSYIGAINKSFNEILDNATDIFVKTNFKIGSKIEVEIDDKSFRVTDDCTGIPVANMQGSKDKILTSIFTKVGAGSNFTEINDDNKDRIGSGTNGTGGTAVNAISKIFIVDTFDNKKHAKLTCKNGMQEIKYDEWDKAGKHGTSVYFEPDLEYFSITALSDVYKKLAEFRLNILAYFYPEIQFYLNGGKIESQSSQNFVSKFLGEDFELISNKKTTIAVGISDGNFKFVNYINALNVYKGGNNIDLIVKDITSQIHEKLVKKYPTIKTIHIKSHLKLIFLGREFPNLEFESQVKDSMVNSIPSIRSYISDLNLDLLARKIMKNENMMLHITENFRIAQEAQESILAKKTQKTLSKKRIEKFYPATKNNKYLVLGEGDSAVGGLIAILGRENFAYMALRGKPINAYEASISNITKNEEAMNILSILDIKIGEEVLDIPFEKVIIASDADDDGKVINGLLIAFFQRFAPLMLEQGRIVRFNTPIMFSKGKDGLPNKWVYDIKEGEEKLKGENNIIWSKGLGSWPSKALRHILNIDGFDNMLMTFTPDTNFKVTMDNWLSSDKGMSDIRKDMIQKTKLNLELV